MIESVCTDDFTGERILGRYWRLRINGTMLTREVHSMMLEPLLTEIQKIEGSRDPGAVTGVSTYTLELCFT